MKSKLLMVAALAAFAVAPVVADIAPARVRVSPHETISAKIDGNRVTVVYGRPYSKDPKTGAARKIWGTLVPFDKVWRAGSDEATLLVTQQPIELGGTLVPAGAYTLFLVPAADGGAKLLVHRQVGQWGNDPYDEKQELARIPLTRSALSAPIDQFTMGVEKNPAGGGVLKLAWESTQYAVNYGVKK